MVFAEDVTPTLNKNRNFPPQRCSHLSAYGKAMGSFVIKHQALQGPPMLAAQTWENGGPVGAPFEGCVFFGNRGPMTLPWGASKLPLAGRQSHPQLLYVFEAGRKMDWRGSLSKPLRKIQEAA